MNTAAISQEQDSLSEMKESIKRKIRDYENLLQVNRNQLSKLETLKMITNKDLYDCMDDIIEVVVEKDKYEHTTGGDGRSSPWSEEREGLVAKLRFKDSGIWLSKPQLKIVRDYITNVYQTDNIITVETPNCV